MHFTNSILRVAIISTLLLTTAQKTPGQIDEKKLSFLKEKNYPWGNIYVTYIGLIDLSGTLQDKAKKNLLIKENGAETVSTLEAILKQYNSLSINDGISFIEINLNSLAAGFKKADEIGGAIRPLPWSKEQVVNIAYLCHKGLDGLFFAKNTLSYINQPHSSLDSGFTDLERVEANNYVSSETYFSIAKEFRKVVASRSNELDTMNEVARVSIKKFNDKFDKNYFQSDNLRIAAQEKIEDNINANKLRLERILRYESYQLSK